MRARRTQWLLGKSASASILGAVAWIGGGAADAEAARPMAFDPVVKAGKFSLTVLT